jgi:hypothetical protein
MPTAVLRVLRILRVLRVLTALRVLRVRVRGGVEIACRKRRCERRLLEHNAAMAPERPPATWHVAGNTPQMPTAGGAKEVRATAAATAGGGDRRCRGCAKAFPFEGPGRPVHHGGCLPVRLVCVCVSEGCLQCVRVHMRRYFDAYVRACACRRVRVLVHARMRVCFQQCGYCQTV